MTQNSAPPAAAIEAARLESLKAPCLSMRGVAIFESSGAVASVGHNRLMVGECSRDQGCKATCRHWAVHAEQMAILRTDSCAGLDMLHVKTVDGKIVPSGPPSCALCSHFILAAGLSGMWLLHESGWRRYEAAEFHRLSLEAANGT